MWRNRRYHVSIMCFFGTFAMYSCRVCLSVAVVAMTKTMISADTSTVLDADFDWNSSQKSVVLSSFFYGYVPAQIFAGILLEYVSAHIVFGIGAAGSGLLTILTPIIVTRLPFWAFIATRVSMGLFQAVAIPCFMKFWTIWAPPLERARLQGLALSGGFVGTVVALPLSGLVADYAGWEYIFYLFGTVCLVWYAVWLIFIRESPENDSFISNYEKNYIVTAIGKPKVILSRPILWLSIFSTLPIYGVLIAAFAWGWGYVTFLIHMPLFVSDVMDFDLSKNGFLSALPYLAMTVLSLLAGFIADFILVRQLLTATQARKYFISLSMLIQAFFIAMAAYVMNPIPNVICISASIGVGAFTFSGVTNNYMDLAPALAAIIGGLGNTMATLPGIISSLITGVIVQVSARNKYFIGQTI